MIEGFAAVPNWMVRDESISLYAISVYTALASHTGPGGVHPSQSTLAAEARCSERKVRDAIAELKELGVVEVVRRRRKEAGSTTLSNGYVMHPNGRLADDEERIELPAPDAGTGEGVPAPDDRGTGTSVQLVPYIEEEPIKEEPINARDLDSVFEEAWIHWPKRTEKKLSRERFMRAVKKRRTLPSEIITFGDAYTATTPTQYVPALAVWIGRERWTDDLPAARGAGKLSPSDRARQTLALANDQLEIGA